MEGYIQKVLLKYGHTKPTHAQITPHKHQEIKYGSTQKPSPAEDTIPDIDAKGVKKFRKSLEHYYNVHGLPTTNYY